jgi:hypothetical protein
MDTKKLIKDAKARFNHNSSKNYLRDKYKSKLIFAYGGGMWTFSPELISMLSTYPREELVLVDNHDNPILVVREKLLENAINVYESVMQEYLLEYTELQNKR